MVAGEYVVFQTTHTNSNVPFNKQLGIILIPGLQDDYEWNYQQKSIR